MFFVDQFKIHLFFIAHFSAISKRNLHEISFQTEYQMTNEGLSKQEKQLHKEFLYANE